MRFGPAMHSANAHTRSLICSQDHRLRHRNPLISSSIIDEPVRCGEIVVRKCTCSDDIRPSSKVIRPSSKAASQSDERGRPLWT